MKRPTIRRKGRFPSKVKGQISLIPEVERSTPQDFAGQLLRKGLITKTSRGKNVLKEVANAYSRIVRLPKIDLGELVKALKQEDITSAKILHNQNIIRPLTRSEADKTQIRIAVGTIVMFVNRKRVWEQQKRERGQTLRERLQTQAQTGHLKSIAGLEMPKGLMPERVLEEPKEAPKALGFWGKVIETLLRPFNWARRRRRIK